MLKVLGQKLKAEVVGLCSDKFQSITRQTERRYLKNFSVVAPSLFSEFKRRALVLVQLLNSSMTTCKEAKEEQGLAGVTDHLHYVQE